MVKTYIPRVDNDDIPSNTNKYFVRKADGGYNPCVKGSPTHPYLTALSNCVGWVVGRAMEVMGTQTSPLPTINAEDFWYSTNLEKGDKPKNCSIAVWKQGSNWNSKDGCGHVAFVEKAISEDTIVTSESAYGGSYYYNKMRVKGTDGNWGSTSSFQFLGFIYLPDEFTYEEEKDDKKIKVGDTVYFKGGSHYGSSDASSSVGGKRTDGKAKVTLIAYNAKHPYHLIGLRDSDSSNVYGWVDKDLVIKEDETNNELEEVTKPSEPETSSTSTTSLKVGDRVIMTKDGLIYGTNKKYAAWVYAVNLYVREINGDRVVISINKTGSITGAVDAKYLVKK